MDETISVSDGENPDLPPLDDEEVEESAPVDLSPESETATPSLTPESLASLMRLAVGSTFLGTQLVWERLRAWEGAHPVQSVPTNEEESARDRARYALLGFLFHAYESGRRQMALALRAGAAMGSMGVVLMRPVANNPLMSPARHRYDRLVQVGRSRVAKWVETGRTEETRSRQMATDLFQELVREVTVFLGENKDVNELISVVADDLLENLAQDQQVQDLIRVQGDKYLVYLQEENAEQVQVLIQGQSLDLAGQVLDEVRERTVTADSLAERLVRAILRRPQREELPPPPPEVQQWANDQFISSYRSPKIKPEPELPAPVDNENSAEE